MNHKTRRWLKIAAATIALFMASISYALSFGVVMWLYTADWIGVSTYHTLGETVYRPLMWHIDNDQPGGDALRQFYLYIRETASQDSFQDPHL